MHTCARGGAGVHYESLKTLVRYIPRGVGQAYTTRVVRYIPRGVGQAYTGVTVYTQHPVTGLVTRHEERWLETPPHSPSPHAGHRLPDSRVPRLLSACFPTRVARDMEHAMVDHEACYGWP